MRQHPLTRVVVASHGDIIPALLARLCALFDVSVPAITRWGGWYTLAFADGSLRVLTHQPIIAVSRT